VLLDRAISNAFGNKDCKNIKPIKKVSLSKAKSKFREENKQKTDEISME
jgi:hypothetical protein